MYSKVAINIILASVLFVIQLAFISGLPGWFGNLNLILVVLIYILGLSSFQAAWWWSIGLGILLDVYYFLGFGIYLLSLSSAIFLTYLLLNNFFTNRSLYSFLALTFFGSVSYKVVLYFLSFIYGFFYINSNFPDVNGGVIINELHGLAVNIAAAFFIYYFL